jgi:hypothetical protein
MVGCEYDEDRQALAEKVSKRTGGKRTIDDLRKTGVIVGNGAEFKEQLGAMEAAGVQRVMLQWLDLDDLAGLESLARKLH